MSTATDTTATDTRPKNPVGRPPKQAHERRVKKYIGLVPSDLAKFKALEAADPDWLAKMVRAAELPARRA